MWGSPGGKGGEGPPSGEVEGGVRGGGEVRVRKGAVEPLSLVQQTFTGSYSAWLNGASPKHHMSTSQPLRV